MHSWIFSIITPVFSVTWSSEIILICWFAAQETFLIIINFKNTDNHLQYGKFINIQTRLMKNMQTYADIFFFREKFFCSYKYEIYHAIISEWDPLTL